MKGVWKPEDVPEDNVEIKFYDFSEEPESPVPAVDLLEGPLGPEEVGEPSQPRVKVEVLTAPLSKEEKRAQKLKEKEEKRAIKEFNRKNELAIERQQRERQEAAREKQRLEDIAAQNARADKIESLVMSSQSENRERIGNIEILLTRLVNGSVQTPLPIASYNPMPLPIASYNPDQPILSICGTTANDVLATDPAFPIPPDGCSIDVPPVTNASAPLPRGGHSPSGGPTLLDDVREDVTPPLPVDPAADIEKEDLLGFDDIGSTECEVGVLGTSGCLGSHDSGIQVAHSPAREGEYLLETPDERNDVVDYEVSGHTPAKEDAGDKIAEKRICPDIPQHEGDFYELLQDLEAMGCSGLFGKVWDVQDARMLEEIEGGPMVPAFRATIRAKYGNWTRELWRSVYDFPDTKEDLEPGNQVTRIG